MGNIDKFRHHSDDTDPFDNIPAFLKRHTLGAPADEEDNECHPDEDEEMIELQMEDDDEVDIGEDFSLAGDDDEDAFGEFDVSELFGYDDEFTNPPMREMNTIDDYHQYVGQLMHHDKYHQVIELCNVGLRLFQGDMMLTAFRSCSNTCLGDLEAAEKDIGKMLEVPFERWDWHCFEACLKCWMYQPTLDEGKCRRMLDDFKRCFPEMETPYLLEYELELKVGAKTKAYDVLNYAVAHQGNCVQCACELADKQLKNTDYTDAVLTCQSGILGSFQPEYNKNLAKLYSLQFCALCGQMYKRFCDGQAISPKAVKQLIRMGNDLLDDFGHHGNDAYAVNLHIKQLTQLKADCRMRECLPVYGFSAAKENHG